MEKSLSPQNSFKNYVLYLLFFLSGFISLVYEVLWMKELGLLFGNTVYATATVLTAFFCGLGCGTFFWGQRAANINNLLRTYGYLEIAVAISAMGYFAILYAYRAIYPILFEYFFDYPALFIGAKFILSLLLLFLPAFFMGGTLPVMSQFLVRQKNLMGQRVSLLYTLNTLGASCGTLMAGFVLPRYLGFQFSFMVAMAINFLIGLAAILLSSNDEKSASDTYGHQLSSANKQDQNNVLIAGIAFISGLVTLSLQVLWVRMFSQVLHNSVYTFTIILTVFLLLLALGAWFANKLMQLRINHEMSLIVILLLAGLLVISSPFVFSNVTDGLEYIQEEQGWWTYILTVFGMSLKVMGPALLFLGAVLPMTFKLVEKNAASVGYSIGILTSINTVGAVAGSFMAGFFLLSAFGLWQSIHIIACLCFVAGIVLAYKRFSESAGWAPFALSALLFPAVFMDMTTLPNLKLSESAGEKLLELWEGSSGTVAVTDSALLGGLRIKVNNHYNLGGSGASVLEELQTDIPMQLHPAPRDVYVLGLGSGITAGAALKYPVDKLTVTELVPNVIVASEKHFEPFLHGLFTDPRATVIAEDGRNFLEGSRQNYDVIIADLFVPWRDGVGYLYTQEHFQAVARRLKSDGMFMQWLPSHQLTERQFSIIAKTFARVFPQATLWRGDFIDGVSMLGLLGQKQLKPFSGSDAEKILDLVGLEHFYINQLPLLSHYVGNIGAQKSMFENAPLNKDDFPVIVYEAPVTQRKKLARQIDFLTGPRLISLMARIRANKPSVDDGYLSQLSSQEARLVDMGFTMHQSQVLLGQGNKIAADKKYSHFLKTYNQWKYDMNAKVSRF